MTDTHLHASPDVAAPAVPTSAGALLREAREAAGMTIDAVAQQLKLAPRQVQALEDGDYAHLPGRTFVRGFMRNYARLLRLDPDAVLGALPAAPTPMLDSPALHATTQTMGELPTTEAPRHGWTRWAIPLTLVAIIGATAAWEWMHPVAESSKNVVKSATGPERAAAPRTPDVVGTPLPNPVAAMTPPESPASAASAPTAPERAADKAAAEPLSAGAPVLAGPGAPELPLTMSFRDYSWTLVKDRSGRVLLARMNPGRTTQSISGAPPLDVVIGNAADVTVVWRGGQVDLAPYTRQNVARLTLE